MSGREWQPGDVAMVRTVAASEERRAVRRGGVWHMLDGEGYAIDAYTTPVRPLVVLDPEEVADPAILAIACAAGAAALRETNPGRELIDADALDRLADLLEAQTAPPRPPEPQGLGAVVEDEDGEWWVRYAGPGSTAPWVGNCVSVEWADISAVEVLSHGYTGGGDSDA